MTEPVKPLPILMSDNSEIRRPLKRKLMEPLTPITQTLTTRFKEQSNERHSS